MFYSTAENPRLRVTKEEEEQYYDRGFVKIDESAICVVCSKYFSVQLIIDRPFIKTLFANIFNSNYSRISRYHQAQ